jgi:hypothetical protein
MFQKIKCFEKLNVLENEIFWKIFFMVLSSHRRQRTIIDIYQNQIRVKFFDICLYNYNNFFKSPVLTARSMGVPQWYVPIKSY